MHISPLLSTASQRQRNALSTSDINASLRGTAGISRTPSLRDRLRNGEADKKPEEDTRKETKGKIPMFFLYCFLSEFK